MSLLHSRGLKALQGLAGRAKQLGGMRMAGGGLHDPELQDPKATARSPVSDHPKHVPKGEEVGAEKKVKWGVNVPSSAEQLKEEAKYAGEGLAESVLSGVSAVLNKGKDMAAGAKRAMGMESDRPAMSHEHMGAAGKMEHAPPGVKQGGPVGNPRAKYDEIKATEAPNFPAGERSVQEQWERAGSYQNSPEAAAKLAATPGERQAGNEEIRREMEAQHSAGDSSSSPASNLDEYLHNRGP